jgi:hypothetical protein
MRTMFPQFPGITQFAAFNAAYRPALKVQAKAGAISTSRAVHEDDGMEVDDEAAGEALLPSHALDSLHLQVIDHFRYLLQDIVRRVGGEEIMGVSPDAARSTHAPAWSKKHYLDWSAAEALEYLHARKPLPRTQPDVRVFLSHPYTGRGTRRGQDWPRQAWEQALMAILRIGEQWGEASVKESLEVLAPHCAIVFATPMRPTGM